MHLPNIICAFIPKYIANAAVTGVWNLLRTWQRLLKRDFSGNLPGNETAFQNHVETIRKNKGYIEDQHSYEDMAYGNTTMCYAGCPVFAVYNALYHLTGKNDLSLPRLITEFERDGIVLSGKGGTAPKAVRDFLNRHGFQTVMTTNRRKFDETDRASRSLILTIYNDGADIREQIHTIHVSKENGQYTAHNVYCNGRVVGPCCSLEALMEQIRGGRAKILSLIGIR